MPLQVAEQLPWQLAVQLPSQSKLPGFPLHCPMQPPVHDAVQSPLADAVHIPLQLTAHCAVRFTGVHIAVQPPETWKLHEPTSSMTTLPLAVLQTTAARALEAENKEVTAKSAPTR